MGGDEHRPPLRVSILIGADHRFDEFAPDDGIEAGRRFVEDQQFGLGADGRDERQLRALAFRQVARLLADVEPELIERALLLCSDSSCWRKAAK